MARSYKLQIIASMLLVSMIAFQGCRMPDTVAEVPEDTVEDQGNAYVAPTLPVRNPSEPGQFTIRYVPDSSMNPITSPVRDNIVLSSLLYESLFVLDGSLNVRPVLCESWLTEDNITYTFIIKQNIAMSDGSFLTADDVVYTLRQAMVKGWYVNRFSTIQDVASDEELSVTVTLKSENSNFIKLLDIPIIKTGSIDDPIPPGTGPYIFSDTGVRRLTRSVRYRDYDKLPIPAIYLLECNENEIAELFDGGTLSLLMDDLTDTFDIILNRQNEMRLYETTTLQYIGFNARLVVLRDPDVRRAIGSSIDRAYITESIMPGQPLAASLALSPVYKLYDKQWEQMVVDPLREMSALLRRAGLDDFDSDSFLEYPDGVGGYYKISLDFIVNTENKYKVEAAHKIADTLKLYGFEIIVRELTWDNFLNALQSGTFDLYYGEISLGADFDLSPLLLPDSRLNYGLTGSNDIYLPLLRAFLSAKTEDEEKAAAEHLCDEINLNAPFVPILYKRYAVFTPIGAITGASPSQSGVFNNFKEWSVDLTMLR